MLTVVTGASGFIGRALVEAMERSGYPGTVRLVDRARPPARAGRFESLAADLADRTGWPEMLAGADRVIHLAALPGGAAEANPARSRDVNLDLVLDLLAALGNARRPVRFVHASSIAVFGAPLPPLVHDDIEPAPATTYGTHKRMAELAVIDAARRGAVDGLSLRLPGIVARPPDAAGFSSGFMSDVFWAGSADRPYEVPVGPKATLWLMSARYCAANLLHAVSCPLPEWRDRAITSPALHVRMADLVEAVARERRSDPDFVRYAPDAELEAAFGRLPPLRARRAEALGLRSDDSLASLVRAARGRSSAAGVTS